MNTDIENAEKVGYPVVWEEVKDASNVIDYQINEEITKDTSWEINANNDTTTGMATVIPWVNAPKLLADTSIIWWWGKWWGWAIVEISNYTSIDERQPVVDRVLAWEYVCVRCKFSDYSNLQNFFFTPCAYLPNQWMRWFWQLPWSKWFRINCRMSWNTITSIWTSYWDI